MVGLSLRGIGLRNHIDTWLPCLKEGINGVIFRALLLLIGLSMPANHATFKLSPLLGSSRISSLAPLI